MRVARAIVGTFLVVVASAAATNSGCVNSSNPSNGGIDGAAPTEDTGAPLVDGAPPPDHTAPPSDAAGAGEDAGPLTEAGPGVDAADAALPQAHVRFGIFTSPPGIVPSVGPDVCVAPHGTTAWQGPLLAGAGLATGLLPFSVTSYFPVPGAQYDVRVLPAGSSCASPDAGTFYDLTNLPTIPAGVSITVAIVDPVAGVDAGPSGVSALGLVDETTTTAGKAKLRLVNVATLVPDAVSVTLGSGVAAQSLFTNVTSAQRLDPTADSQGYREVDAVPSIDLSFQTQASPAVALTAGTIMTTFVGDNNGDGTSLQVISCYDGKPSTQSAALTDCSVTFGFTNLRYTRFASFLADTSPPSTDVCIRYHGLTTFAGPLLGGPAGDAGADAGPTLALVPPSSSGPSSPLSGYFQVAGGFGYDVRYVPAGTGSCATGVGTDYLYTAPATANATVAATGFVTVPNDAGEPSMFDAGMDASAGGLPSVMFACTSFVDENTADTDAVRVIHMGALDPEPFDVQAASWTFTDIPYGTFGTQPSGADANGYRPVATGGGGFTVLDTIDGNNKASLSFGLASGEADTFFIFTSTFNTSVTVGVLECHDADNTIGGLWSCTTLNGG